MNGKHSDDREAAPRRTPRWMIAALGVLAVAAVVALLWDEPSPAGSSPSPPPTTIAAVSPLPTPLASAASPPPTTTLTPPVSVSAAPTVIASRAPQRTSPPSPRPPPSIVPSPSFDPPFSPAPLRVLGFSVRAVPPAHEGPCPFRFEIRGRVLVAGGPGRLRYRWERSDRARAPEETIEVVAPGEVEIDTEWRLGMQGEPRRLWMTLHVLAPQDVRSPPAQFRLVCTRPRPQP